MANAPIGENVIGYFIEKTCGRLFDYALNSDMTLFPLAHGGKNVLYPHKIFVGPDGKDYRYAFVKGNVAHVVVDETELGWKVEKWDIVRHRKFS
jgi:hypothetical protein